MDERVATLGALADAFLPQCEADCQAADDPLAATYYRAKGSEMEGAMLRVIEAIETRLPSSSRWPLNL